MRDFFSFLAKLCAKLAAVRSVTACSRGKTSRFREGAFRRNKGRLNNRPNTAYAEPVVSPVNSKTSCFARNSSLFGPVRSFDAKSRRSPERLEEPPSKTKGGNRKYTSSGFLGGWNRCASEHYRRQLFLILKKRAGRPCSSVRICADKTIAPG